MEVLTRYDVPSNSISLTPHGGQHFFEGIRDAFDHIQWKGDESIFDGFAGCGLDFNHLGRRRIDVQSQSATELLGLHKGMKSLH